MQRKTQKQGSPGGGEEGAALVAGRLILLVGEVDAVEGTGWLPDEASALRADPRAYLAKVAQRGLIGSFPAGF